MLARYDRTRNEPVNGDGFLTGDTMNEESRPQLQEQPSTCDFVLNTNEQNSLFMPS